MDVYSLFIGVFNGAVWGIVVYKNFFEKRRHPDRVIIPDANDPVKRGYWYTEIFDTTISKHHALVSDPNDEA